MYGLEYKIRKQYYAYTWEDSLPEYLKICELSIGDKYMIYLHNGEKNLLFKENGNMEFIIKNIDKFTKCNYEMEELRDTYSISISDFKEILRAAQ